MSTKKIYILFPSATGHINPVLGLVQQLCKQPNIECIFYGNEEHKDLINRTGSKFRLYANRNYANMLEADNKGASFIRFLETMIDCSYDILPQLLNDYEQDKPDLVLYDCLFLSARFLYVVLLKRGINLKMVEFFPNFAMNKSIIESVPELNLFEKNFNTLLKMAQIFMKQAHLSWSYDLSVYNTMNFLFEKREYTQIVAVFPELQPKVEEFGEFKFIGQCVAEDVRNNELDKDQELKSILLKFDSNKETDKSKLILVSIGTVYNYNTFVFEEIIKAVQEYNKPSRRLNSSQLLVIISLGDISFKTLKEKIKEGELNLPENIILRSKVPQLDILKRSDLFITHCGMNSTTETIKYGVPIIGIPIQGDQPLVARRVCDELSAGIRLNTSNLKSDDIGDAIDKVLTDEKYAKNMKDLSIASAKHNGIVEGTKIVLELLGK